MSKSVAPEYDYTWKEDGDALVFRMKTPSPTRFRLGLIGSVVFAFFGIPTLLYSFVGGRNAFYVACVLLGLWALSVWFSRRKTDHRIRFDAHSIDLNGRRYAIEHVNGIGCDTTGANVFAPARGSYALAREFAGCSVYMTYGSKRIPLIQGLSAQNVEHVYQRIVGFLARFGHQFG